MAFPLPGLAGLAWIAPGLMLLAALGCRGQSAFRIGYAAGGAHYLASLHWLLFNPFPAGAVAGWLALSAYLALYPALWVWICWRLFPAAIDGSSSSDAMEEQATRVAAHGMFPRVVEQFLATSLLQRVLWAFACAIVWTASEMCVARVLTGFPWNFLGVSQYRILPVIQIASVTGVYGVSFLVVWFSVALACACLALVARPKLTSVWFGDLLIPSLAVAAVCGFGVRQIVGRTATAAGSVMKIALVQPSIPQTLIWDPRENTNRFRQLLELSERALAEKPELLVWPEAAVPNLLRYEPETYAAVKRLVTAHRVWMILGADDAVPRGESASGREFDYYNSSFLINPAGEIVGTYRKRRLVIFGEYVPLSQGLPFLKFLTPIGEGFKPGAQAVPFAAPGLRAKTSALICFEDAFPHLARECAEADTDFLLNLTNNGWFGESSAQWQHAANAAFRAVENGLPLVRCANNGLSCWVDASGGLRDVYFQGSKDIYQAGFKIVDVPIPDDRKPRQGTFYNRHGDWFGWGCVTLAIGLMGLGLAWREGKKS